MHSKLKLAMENIDWEQAALNGGPPCLFVSDERFCLRAERWPGHGIDHDYVSVLDLLKSLVADLETSETERDRYGAAIQRVLLEEAWTPPDTALLTIMRVLLEARYSHILDGNLEAK